MNYESDKEKMQVALEQARLAFDRNEIPVGAALFNEKNELQSQMTMNTKSLGRQLGRQRPAGFFHALKHFKGKAKRLSPSE